VERALNDLEGVASKEVNLDTKLVKVSYNEQQVNEGQIKEAIEDVGFDVE
jgi:copper chaperone CopZ